MTTSLPSLQQQSPKVPAKNARTGSPAANAAQGFGKLMKADGHKGQPLAAQKADADTDTRTAKLAADQDVVKDGLLSAKGGADTLPEADGGEGAAADDVEADPDPADGTSALLPLLGVAEFRNSKGPRDQGGEPSADGRRDRAARGAARELPSVPREDKALLESRLGRLASLVEPPDPAARSVETAFGRTLAANLNDLATQAPERLAIEEVSRATRTGGGAESDAQPATGKDAPQRDRNTIIPEAVTSAREPRQAGDRRAEARTASADPKALVAPSMPMPLSIGAPIVQALSARPVSTVAATAVEIASQGAALPAQTLKIQLHPAELGMVTANLRMADGQLTIEIEVETPEAYNKLSSENGAIARALRNHGIAVDNVVIQAPQAQTATSARDGAGTLADSAPDAGRGFSGGGEFGQSNGSGHANRNAGHDNGQNVDKASVPQNRPDGGDAGRGVYI